MSFSQCLNVFVPGGKPQSSGKAWQPIDKDASNPSQPKWNPLPEWASDDSGGGQGVGTFDSSGHFTSSSKVNDGYCMHQRGGGERRSLMCVASLYLTL